MSVTAVEISVIVPTRNRAVLLDRMLQSLYCQTLSPEIFEIVVVDNGSSDQTPEVVRDHASRMTNLRSCRESEAGLHAGRHRGLRESAAEVLVFTDDDVEATPSWLTSVRESFAEPETAMVGGNNIPLWVQDPPGWLKKMWYQSRVPDGNAIPQLSLLQLSRQYGPFDPLYVWGCNFAIRRSVLIEAGGFHPDGVPLELIRFRGDGETHVSRYILEQNMKCLYHPEASVYHKVTPERMTFGYFRQRGFCQGVSDSFTALRAASEGNPGPVPVRRLLGRMRTLLRTILRQVGMQPGVLRAYLELEVGHRKGFAFHQNAYRTDPDVREWVLKPSYLK